MMNSQKKLVRFIFTPRTLALLACVGLLAISIAAQTSKAPLANPAASLEQCRNGGTAPGVPCAGAAWVTGNAGFSNSHWAENQFLPYRMLFSNLSTTGTHTVIIGYDILKNGAHAIDYLGTYNATDANADPCDGGTTCSGAPSPQTLLNKIPKDTVTVDGKPNPNGGTIHQTDGYFTMWGGTITNVAYVTYAGGDERQIAVTFTASIANPVLAWSGHVGWIGDWGVGNSAGGISGSPYHMRLIDLDGAGGNQDRSLSADAVIASGAVFIIKTVTTIGGGTAFAGSFPFTATANFGPTSFSLIDNNVQGPDTQQSQAITLFGPTNTITVTEGSLLGTGWTLANVNCVETATQDSTKNSIGPASIIVQPGEVVTCTFSNTQQTPSAAPASINGRVVTVDGRGIRGAFVSLVDVNTGTTLTAVTNSFGYYAFEDLPTEDFYTASVSAKGYKFTNSTTSFTLLDNIVGLDFVAAQ